MEKVFFYLGVCLLFIGCNHKDSAIQIAVDAVNETTPAPTWDGQSLKSVEYVVEDNVVSFVILNARGRTSDYKDLDEEENKKLGTWYIANFMTGYDCSTDGKGGEGDEDMFRQLGPLLKLIAEKEVGIRFRLKLEKGGSYIFDMSPDDVKEAVKLRKSDL